MNDPSAGTYIRIGGNSQPSELTLSPVPDDPEGNSQYCITGIALHGEDRLTGPNIGKINYLGSLDEGKIILNESIADATMNVTLQFTGHNQLEVLESSSMGWHGFGVDFSGLYDRR
jgi:hypothetical protein